MPCGAATMGRAEDMSQFAKICLGIPIAILSFPLMYVGLLVALVSHPAQESPVMVLLALLSIINSLLWGGVIMQAASAFRDQR